MSVGVRDFRRKLVAELSSTKINDVNVFSGKFNVIAEPRLSDNSATHWYLAADTSQTAIIELARLNGQGPSIESRDGFYVDGMEVKTRYTLGARVLDWRGLFRNGA